MVILNYTVCAVIYALFSEILIVTIASLPLCGGRDFLLPFSSAKQGRKSVPRAGRRVLWGDGTT